ncbi:MAG: DUF1614 domain-containing protein [Desulfobacterales bacterium]|nr:DUF1614 domain-containing protein [Desulfobacterales bacterium]MBS3755130.1 DUF1614 domain-containing protein [Desulfobacterales bacterium]
MHPNVPYGCLPLAMFAMLVILLPIFLADVMLTALARLGLSPTASVFAALGIFMGSLVNIPVRRIARDAPMAFAPYAFFGLQRVFPGRIREQAYTVISVNVGGCIVPCIIAVYELLRLAASGPQVLALGLLAIGINVAVCYRIAYPIQNVGIAMPALVPALVAAASAILLHPGMAPPIAFCAGVLGPLIGADLLNLKEIEKISTGAASIGGAGTFDGIVISGLLATLLA